MVAMKPRILIIGAGMAGLAAAHQLQRASYSDTTSCFEVIVLEGSHRIGGRICTSRYGGARVELGATWIHGIEGSPIYEICKRIGSLNGDIPWERQDGFPDAALVTAEGGLSLDPSLVTPVVDMYQKLISEAKEKGALCNTKSKARSVGAFLRESFKKRNGHIQEEESVENQLGWSIKALQDGIFSMHECMERVLTACDSLFDLDLECEKEYKEYPGEHISIGKGFMSVINELASTLPCGSVQFGKKVQKVVWSRLHGFYSFPVAVICEDGSLIEADHVIITVSLGVLKAGTKSRIQNGTYPCSGELFEPPLPSWKLQSISSLGYGVVDKLFLQIDPHLGQELCSHLQFIYKSKSTVPWWMRKTFSLCPIYKDATVLLAWLAGEEAKEMERLTDEEVIEGVVNTLSQFGYPSRDPTKGESCDGREKLRKMFKGVFRSGWGKDPLFMGSYSYAATGSCGHDFETLAEPLPKVEVEHGGNICNGEMKSLQSPALQLLFAGEATDRHYYSTTHGAYRSGIREANRLLHHYGFTAPIQTNQPKP